MLDTLGAVRAAFEPAHRRRVPGLAPVPMDEWLALDHDEPARLEERDALVARHGAGVVALAPGAEPAFAAFAGVLGAALARAPGYRVEGEQITRPDGVILRTPEDVLARATADDWLLMVPGPGAGEPYVLAAGSACYPAHWWLPEKLGQTLDVIHGPVPEYAGHVAARVNRIFANLGAGAPLERFNWGLVADQTRHTPPQVHPEIAPEGPYLRVERQALLRPEGAEVVIFSVRTSVASLAGLDPVLRDAVRAAVLALSVQMRGYKMRRDVLEAALAPLGITAAELARG